jgi:hypothetical protein
LFCSASCGAVPMTSSKQSMKARCPTEAGGRQFSV